MIIEINQACNKFAPSDAPSDASSAPSDASSASNALAGLWSSYKKGMSSLQTNQCNQKHISPDCFEQQINNKVNENSEFEARCICRCRPVEQ